jgi:hypothetical protein
MLALKSQQSLAAAPILEANRYVWSAQTVTTAGRVRATITKTKPKLLLAKSQRPLAKLFADNGNDDYYDDLPDYQVGYRRPELVNQSVDLELSDEIKIRLALARMKALTRYNETWA